MSVPSDAPTPLLLVSERLRLAPKEAAQERFDAAIFLAEATIKFATCTGLSVLRSYSAQAAQAVAYELVRADSSGVWVSRLGQIAQRLHRLPLESGRQFARGLTRKESPEKDAHPGELARLTRKLTEVVKALDEPDYPGLDRKRHSLVDVMGDITFIRNRTRGHGAKTWRFYSLAADAMAEASEIIVRRLPVTFKWGLVLASKTPTDGSVQVLALTGLSPQERESFETPLALERGATIVASGDFVGPLEPLAEVVADTFETFFANGAWRDSSAVCQFLDYRSGKTQHLHRPSYAGRLPQLPPSETAPEPHLTYESACAHNLPPAPEGYVRRPGLESRLQKLLHDKVHRLITLRGPGGSGKTSLALNCLHDLIRTEAIDFDVILWFSARDVDLLSTGPAPRRREAGDLDTVVRTFVALVGNDGLEDEGATEFFAASVDGSRSASARYLLVMDNFETFDFPAAVHQFLDETVVLPSKVLITSRHRTFQGDFPLEVRGMEDDEAQDLLTSEARRHFCEPRFTEEVRRQIIDDAGALPYVLKLAVAQIAAGEPPSTVRRTLARREDVLSALFDRSYEMFSEDGRFLYLLLGAIGKPALEIALRAAVILAGCDFDEGLQELTRYSLGLLETDAYENSYVALEHLAFTHAKRMLIGHEDELLIERRARDFRRWSSPRPGQTVVGGFFGNLFEQARELPGPGDERWEELISLAEGAAESYPDLCGPLAHTLDSAHADPVRVRGAFKRAVETAPLDPEHWIAWAAFERRQGDQLQFLYKSIRAVELDSSKPQYCSEVAFQLAEYLTSHKEDIPPERRDMLLGSVRFAMEAHRRQHTLDADDLSRLGWLYLLEYSPTANPDIEFVRQAQACAREGLQLEPENTHCKRLLDRTTRELV